MEFIDTHCHIQSSDRTEAADAGEAVTRKLWSKASYPSGDNLVAHAAEAGVTKMICVGCSLPDSVLAVDFVQSRPQCWASIGIHPHEATHYVSGQTDGLQQLDMAQLEQFALLAAAPRVIAIGECGLDYFYKHSNPSEQALILRYQMELALEHDLPLIFHVREAFDDFWPIYDEVSASYKASAVTPKNIMAHSGGLRGVLHSYTDNLRNLEHALSRGLYIGVNGISTFTKSDQQLQMYKTIPLSSLLLETDAPFLTPSPYRGNICEPYHTSVTAEFLAGLRNKPIAELAVATTLNARKLFLI